MTQNKVKKELLKKVSEIELEMFRLANSTICSPSQEKIEKFNLMRRMHHSVWPLPIIESYLKDLTQGKTAGRNFIAEKFAQLESRIPIIKESLQLDEIVETELSWMADVSEKYPTLFPPLDSAVAEYIQCEYAVLSDPTINQIRDCVVTAKATGLNMVEERYKNLCHDMGYESIIAMEHATQAEECV